LQTESSPPPYNGNLGPKPFSPETLAERWGCSAEKVRQMVHRGELRGFRLGKLIRIKAIEVERYECSQLRETNTFNSSPTGGSLPSQLDVEKIVAESRLARMTLA
jgi:excisionase family DNA binding protein